MKIMCIYHRLTFFTKNFLDELTSNSENCLFIENLTFHLRASNFDSFIIDCHKSNALPVVMVYSHCIVKGVHTRFNQKRQKSLIF